MQWIDRIDWTILVVLCLTLGLAPFKPPHIVEKIGMLVRGDLVRPIDWFDLVLHVFPWALLATKGVLALR